MRTEIDRQPTLRVSRSTILKVFMESRIFREFAAKHPGMDNAGFMAMSDGGMLVSLHNSEQDEARGRVFAKQLRNARRHRQLTPYASQA